MAQEVTIPNDPNLDGLIEKKSGRFGVIIAHGSDSDINSGIIPSLSKKLAEKNISSLRFRFPFKMENRRYRGDIHELDRSYASVYDWTTKTYSDITWLLGGYDIGAEAAIRATGLIMTEDGSIPNVISLNYPLYPPNRPEKVDASSLGAVMGDIIFIQAENSNRGSFDRLKNQVNMMVPHAEMKRIGNANHEFKVEGKSFDRVAYWISNDIYRFIKNIY